MGASVLDQSATGTVLRISATGLTAERRVRFMSEEISDRLVSARARAFGEGEPNFDYGILALGSGPRVLDGRLSGFEIERTSTHVADGDDGFSLFVALSGSLQIEQNDRRITVARGAGVLVRHGRPIYTRFCRSRFVVLQIARSAMGPSASASIRAAPLEAGPERMTLLSGYMQAALAQGCRGQVPEVVGHHLHDLAAAAFLPDASPPAPGSCDARTAARVEAMRASIARRYNDPSLSMATVAAQVGLSERSGYLAFEAAGRRFSGELTAARLQAAAAMLRSGAGRVLDVAFAVGFNDVSHFNRCFRSHFGCTPSEMRHGVPKCPPDSSQDQDALSTTVTGAPLRSG